MRIDPFLVLLLSFAGMGIVLPAQGTASEVVGVLVQIGIAMLFFLYGARLSTAEVRNGATAWRAHLLIVSITFGLFPLLGLSLHLFSPAAISPALLAALLFLCTVPSTVQSSVAFTGIAGGDGAVAVVAASLSSLLGVFLTPLLVAALIGSHAAITATAIGRIVLLLLLPFALGQLSRRWLAGWVNDHRSTLLRFDRSTVLLVVYAGFSKGTNAGVWSQLRWLDAAVVIVSVAALLAISSAYCLLASKRFDRGTQIAIYFCGTNKSLAAGLPIASVLFSASTFPLMILPLMLYHQLQLIVGSFVASRWANKVRAD
ncbi:MAG TPA: bile acid:sodium symporter family protein [Aeromicrobium sp.]|nr:bile acid:sodium symporter family protein [Aeromicrobium sp.]